MRVSCYGGFGCQWRRDLNGNTLKTGERPWEWGRFGGHRLKSEDLIDYALIFFLRAKIREGVSNQQGTSFSIESFEGLADVIRVALLSGNR